MIRQFIIYLLLSILVVVFAKYAHFFIAYIGMLCSMLKLKLTPLFSQAGWGPLIPTILVLMSIPLLIAAVPAVAYRFIKGQEMPHFLALTWILWIIVALSTLLMR